MEHRKLEKLGIAPSLLGFGCMRFPLTEEGNINEAEAEKMLDTAIAAGVNYIDTAYPYHNGDSEPFVGRVLKNMTGTVSILQPSCLYGKSKHWTMRNESFRNNSSVLM